MPNTRNVQYLRGAFVETKSEYKWISDSRVGANSTVEIPRKVEVISEDALSSESVLLIVAFDTDSNCGESAPWHL
jgi:hypothetical protein